MKQLAVASMFVAVLSACGGGGSDSAPPATHFSVSATAGSVVSGHPVSITVQTLDDSNKLVSSFAGALQVTSSDANATLPGTQSLTGGTVSFSVTFHTTGPQTIAVSSGSLSGTSPAIAVYRVAVTITSRAPPQGAVGTRYDAHRCYYKLCPGFALTATPGTNLTWSWSAQSGSSVPPGLSVSGSFIVGTPTKAGTYAVVITVASSGAAPASLPYNITIANPPPPTISSLPGPQGATLNQPYSYTFVRSGYAVTVSATGALPAGLAPVTPAGVLAGTPTVTGSFPIVVNAVDGVGQTATQDFSIQVFPHGFGPTGSMQSVRNGHTATLLSNGQALVAGGYTAAGPGSMATAEIFDPGKQLFTATGNMTTPRAGHTATLLCDVAASPCVNPRVLLAGGLNSATLATAELFDPAAGTFASTGSLNQARFSHTATLLGNGKVLIAGGADSSNVRIASAELFDPATVTFATTGSLLTGRYGHTATLLTSGKVLIAGGADDTGTPLASAELYDPVAGTFANIGPMQAARFDHTATLLANGKVLIVGGAGSGEATAELYDAASGTFATTGSPALGRMAHGAALLPDATVLVAGGYYSPGNVVLAEAELYDPKNGTFSETGGLQNARDNVLLTGLGGSGGVLLTGGAASSAATAAELYR